MVISAQVTTRMINTMKRKPNTKYNWYNMVNTMTIHRMDVRKGRRERGRGGGGEW